MAIFRTVMSAPLIIIFGGLLYFLFLTNLPQWLYFNSIRNIYFDCMDFSGGGYVYKMKPGPCRVKNIEYDVVLSSDADGFRNTLRASSDYDVAVIGDSYAQGLGVADNQTFSYLLENTYGYKTVNLGIGSYATMRELEALKEYGQNAKYVVVEYCDNDFPENQAALSLSREAFLSQVETQWRALAASYRDGKMSGYRKPLHDLGVMIKTHSYSAKSGWIESRIRARPMEEEAAAFAKIADRYRSLLEGKRLIVFETALWGANSPKFDAAFGSELSKLGWLNYKLLNNAQILNSHDYFFLDDHITAAGHRKLAAAVARKLDEWESADPWLRPKN
jgi:hypothetical protein